MQHHYRHRLSDDALRTSFVTSMWLGFGLAVVGVLLAEITLSSAGLGFLANEHYSQSRLPDLYAVILLISSYSRSAPTASWGVC